MKIKELLKDESNWTQDKFARDENGMGVSADNSTAVCWCLTGAIYRCYHSDDDRVVALVTDYIFETFNTYGIAHWNDLPTTTFSDIKQLIETLDI